MQTETMRETRVTYTLEMDDKFIIIENVPARVCEETGEQAGSQKRFGGQLAERGFLNHRDSKTGRKVWSGLSLRPNWESRAGISLNHPNIRFAGNSESTEPSEPKNNKVPYDLPREAHLREKGSDGSEGSEAPVSRDLAPGQSATIEQLQRIRELVRQGFSERAARIEVLAKGHRLGCDCAVCS